MQNNKSLKNKKNLPSIKGTLIISLSSSPWYLPYWTSRQFLMYELSKYASILYVTDRMAIDEFLKFSYWKKLLFQKPSPPFSAPDDLKVFEPKFLEPLIYGHPQLDRFFTKRFCAIINKKCSQFKPKKIVAYIWEPRFQAYLNGIKADKIIYHPYDKFDLFVNNKKNKKIIQHNENKILKRADIVITPHRKIADCFKHHNTHVIHNGVFMHAFTKNGNNTSAAAILDNIPPPRTGYIGVINAKIDFDLLFTISKARSDWSFILLGPIMPGEWQNDPSFIALKKLPNVYFLPPAPFNEIPSCISKINIGIMPYDLKTWAGYCESPLKMYQYWAAKVPIVSVPLPTIANDPGIISIAATPNEWIEAISWEIDHDSSSLKKDRYKKAIENSWSNRAKQVIKIIHKS